MLFRASNSKMQSDFFLLLVVALKVAFPKYIKVEALLLAAAVSQCVLNLKNSATYEKFFSNFVRMD